MEINYRLTVEASISLSILLLADFSLRQAALQLDIIHSTLSRELRRNPPARQNYSCNPGDAQPIARNNMVKISANRSGLQNSALVGSGSTSVACASVLKLTMSESTYHIETYSSIYTLDSV